MILPSDVTRIQEETDADQKNSRQIYEYWYKFILDIIANLEEVKNRNNEWSDKLYSQKHSMLLSCEKYTDLTSCSSDSTGLAQSVL